MVSRAKTELWHRLLTHYLPLYFPEAERFQGNSRMRASDASSRPLKAGTGTCGISDRSGIRRLSAYFGAEEWLGVAGMLCCMS